MLTDDRFTFYSNGSLIQNPSALVCGAVSDTNNWTFAQNQTRIVIIFDQTDTANFKIESISTNALRLVGLNPIGPTSTLSDTIQFVYP